MTILGLLLLVLFLGFCAFMVDKAPFIDPPFKTLVKFFLFLLAALLLVLAIASLLGVDVIGPLRQPIRRG